MSQLVFGLRVNAQRSGCPINLALETLRDRPLVKGTLLGMHRTSGIRTPTLP
ncbi:hypothetical protein IE4872_PD01536 (plasmid) [Rhizobium gallicum]|uniref:Uncharacterized protein n=1 Tax=Rhizobium gallicum TaxID=56730 RepID=A0A1L5NVX8_9HYPH|nr:hypothetical protein IE4872_PD01536 [Rhizobium gallicum]